MTALELKLIRELVARHGMDTVVLSIMSASAGRAVELETAGKDKSAKMWNTFADRMNDEYIWCKKHLY